MILTIEEQVSFGARWLDIHEPDWFKRVDTSILTIHSVDRDGKSCILEQVYKNVIPGWSGYVLGCNRMDTDPLPEQENTDFYGTACNKEEDANYVSAWTHEIMKRRMRDEFQNYRLATITV